MEENNKKVIIKGSVIIILAILGLNVYRTETMKLEIARLTTKVEQLSEQLDSLGVVKAPAVTAPASTGISKKEFTTLSQSVSSLESKVATLQETVDCLSRSQAQSGGSSTVSVSTTSGQASSTASTTSTSPAGRVSVSAKVKVENRYVGGTTYLPKVATGPTGIVVINVIVNRTGTVGSVSVGSSSTIIDEDILDACKEAALKTSFAYNPEVPDKSKGTITYTFTAK